MRDGFYADGDRWRVTREAADDRLNVRTFVFHCLSDSGRPYRVVQVPPDVVSARTVAELDESELSDLFNRSQTMDYSHDVDAHPEGHGITEFTAGPRTMDSQ